MKGTFFNQSLEWSVETQKESWQQGEIISGTLRIKNSSNSEIPLNSAGVGLAHADLKKVFAKTEGALKPVVTAYLDNKNIGPNQILELIFKLYLPENCQVTDKKGSFFLTYGQQASETHLQIKVEPKLLFTKVIGLLDTFHRFKLKEFKASKGGVEYKLLPPTSRDMANIDSIFLTFSTNSPNLIMKFDFQVKRLDTASITTKINKESLTIIRELTPKDYSFGGDMINQDQILKVLSEVINEVKMKSVF